MSCPACGGALVPWREVHAGEPDDDRTFMLLRCASCGTGVTTGEPPGDEAYESGVYSPGEPRAKGLVRRLQRMSVSQPVRMLRSAGLGDGARVLDAGAGRGRLVAALRDAGFDASGIEPSERSSRQAREAGIPVAAVPLEQHEARDLDAVVLWHVLEHVEEPRAALERVRSWLRPGGFLLVGIPNPASLQARIGGAAWLHWDAPRHRRHLTPAGLGALLGAAGFEAGRARHMIWEQNPHAMWMAILGRAGMTPNLPFHLLKRNASPTARDALLLVVGVPLAPLAVLLEAAAAGARRGGTIAVVAARA